MNVKNKWKSLSFGCFINMET